MASTFTSSSCAPSLELQVSDTVVWLSFLDYNRTAGDAHRHMMHTACVFELLCQVH